MPCNGVQMDRSVCGTTNRRVDHNRILKRLAGHDVRGTQIFPYHVHDTFACFVADLTTLTVRRWNRGTSRQLHAQTFGQGIHRGRCAHRVAISNRGCRGGGDFHEAVFINLARRKLFPRFPNHRARASAFAVPPTVEHWANRQRDRRNVNRCGGHKESRGRLVTANRQHDTVNRIAIQGLDQA